MKNHTLFFIIFAVGIISVAELTVILTTISPHRADKEVFWVFFLFLFTGLTSILSLIWYALKRSLIYRINPPSVLRVIRQAGLFSLIIVLSLFFNSLGILSIWDIIPLFISAILIEFFFQADKAPTVIADHERI